MNFIKENFRVWGQEDIDNQNALSSIAKRLEKLLKDNNVDYDKIDFDIFDHGFSIIVEGADNLDETIELIENELGFYSFQHDGDLVIDVSQEYEDEDGDIYTRVSREYLEEAKTSDKCALCGKEILGYGNNGQPLVNGRVCDDCNKEVIKARISNLKESNSESSDIAYHGTNTNTETILKDGFKGESVFFSDDKYDAEGYGIHIIGVKNINSLSLYELSEDELSNINEVIENVKSTRNYDGVKYRYSKDRPYNYEISDIVNLNKLERFNADEEDSLKEIYPLNQLTEKVAVDYINLTDEQKSKLINQVRNFFKRNSRAYVLPSIDSDILEFITDLYIIDNQIDLEDKLADDFGITFPKGNLFNILHQFEEPEEDSDYFDESVNQLKDMADKAKKKQKGLGAFVKLDAGNVEQNVATFNANMTPNIGEDLELSDEEIIEPRTINIKHELRNHDMDNEESFGNLSDMYEFLESELSIDDKKNIISFMLKGDYDSISKSLNDKIDNKLDSELGDLDRYVDKNYR